MSSSIEERLSREVLRKLRLVHAPQSEACELLCCSVVIPRLAIAGYRG